MQVNEEIDALRTSGISPIEFLVLPRVAATALMMPLLTLYADLMGILGGVIVAVIGFDISLWIFSTDQGGGQPCQYRDRRLQRPRVRRARRPDRVPARHTVRAERLGRRERDDESSGLGHCQYHRRHGRHYGPVRRAQHLEKRRGRLTPGNSDDSHIVVRDLTMAYGSKVIQRDLTFTVNRGDVFIIMGGSGCGKSTLMRHLVGLRRPRQ